MGAFAIQLLLALPQLIKAGLDITGVVDEATTKIRQMQAENREPTPEEWRDLNERIQALRNELHAGEDK